LKNLERLFDLLGSEEAAPRGGNQETPRSQGVEAALDGDPPGATFVDEKDCRLGRGRRNQNCFSLAGGDVTRLLKLDSLGY
jgi:hypothetical protein